MEYSSGREQVIWVFWGSFGKKNTALTSTREIMSKENFILFDLFQFPNLKNVKQLLSTEWLVRVCGVLA